MANITAFRGIRPRTDLTARIAALPYDVYNRKEALEEVRKEPLSFLRIDRAETQFPEGTDIYDPKVYQKARELLWQMKADGEFIQDETDSFYVYELTMNKRAQTGLVACASVQDYLDNVILKHENTREEKEQDRIRHVDTCDAQTGPIFLAYRHNDLISEKMNEAKKKAPLFDFVSPDGIGHRGWKIDEPEVIAQIEEAFSKIGQIYIADGHHRAASAVKVGLKRRTEKKQESDRFLSVLFAEDELRIMDYNRAVRDLNGWSAEQLIEKIGDVAEIEKADRAPQKKGEVSMYLQGCWYQLCLKESLRSEDPVEDLDVSILQKQILEPLLGIKDPRTDERIQFIGGIRGREELERITDAQGGVAFAMYPTSMKELFDVADAHRLMPPKSTWFEPKLRSGLFIHDISGES
ncbi:MAG: DUF1015 family protein [Eubacteriales bacterium]|nr:DUF1015 family protein [Eubacteriales bacterium]